MCVVVPVVMLLDILWSLYDRECAWALTILGVSLIALWICRQDLSSMYLGTFVRIAAIVYIVLLAVIAFLTHRIDQHNGKLGKFQVLPASADPLPVYVACGLSAAGMVCALISASVAYYAMWTLAIVVFAPPSALSPAFTEKCGGDPAAASCVSSLCILTALLGMTAVLALMNL